MGIEKNHYKKPLFESRAGADGENSAFLSGHGIERTAAGIAWLLER